MAKSRQITMPAEATSLLGLLPDVTIARRFDLPVATVADARRAAGIAPRPRDKIPDDAIARLGKQTDVSIAVLYGVDANAVARWRQQRDIPRYSGLQERVPLTKVSRKTATAVRKLLGTASDTTIARTCGVRVVYVRALRKRLGVAPVYQPRKSEIHGTSASYGLGCRCTVCNDYNTARCREYNTRAKYGMTADDLSKLIEAQRGCCAICCAAFDMSGKRPYAIDHDHDTKKVRGLLCLKCNLGLGYFDDDIARLASASKYIERSRS